MRFGVYCISPCLQPDCDLHILCVTLDAVCYVTGYIKSHSLLQYGLLFIVYSTLTRVIAKSKHR